MSGSQTVPRPVIVYRFGPYEADTAQNCLRKFGLRVKLERKPLQLLTALVERAGETVSRGELQRLLWGEDLYGDFEKGLNVAVTKLRAALNDSAEKPRYIETVSGQGYRFMAAVEQLAIAVPRPASAQPECPAVSARASATNAIEGEPGSAPAPIKARPWVQRQRVPLAIAVVFCVALLWFSVTNLLSGKAPSQSEVKAPAKLMLVVLPFENLSGDPGEEYLSDGLTEELSAQLGNLNPARLAVIGRTSAMTYKHSQKTITQIGKELGVAYVLEGSVRRDAAKVRVTAQLIQVSDQTHLWSADYDRDMHSLLQVEDEIAREITWQVGVSVAVNSTPNVNRHIPSTEAHESYLLGRFYWNKRTSDGYRIGGQYFRAATEKDPQYAAAYAGLAESGIPTAEAKAAALKAVELDPTSGEARTALGWVELFREVDVPAAEQTLKTAIELDPNYATAHHWYAFVMEATGHLDQAMAEISEAAKLDPLSLIIRSALASGLSGIAGQDDAALAQLKFVFDVDPNYPKGHEELGKFYERKGMYQEAIREFQISGRNGGDPMWADIGYIYAISGKKQEALGVLARLEHTEASPVELALANIGLGRKDEAIAWLQKGLLEPDDGWLGVQGDRRFDPIRSDPRFQELLRRMKLAN